MKFEIDVHVYIHNTDEVSAERIRAMEAKIAAATDKMETAIDNTKKGTE